MLTSRIYLHIYRVIFPYISTISTAVSIKYLIKITISKVSKQSVTGANGADKIFVNVAKWDPEKTELGRTLHPSGFTN